MADIMKAHIFGTCEAGIYIIEFQKRGLPHVHMLIWPTADFKCKTPEDIDDIISAEIPSKTQDPNAYKAVTEYMLHGACGGNILDAPCIIDKKCSKHFPKPYNAETTIDEDGYAHYRRRNTGIKVSKGKGTLNNGFVVPYNRYLLPKYSAHINVEWCNRSRAIKLLLNKVKGPQTYEEIHTVDGTLHPTFKDACFAYGLINDDREWTTAINEARLWASGAQLRDLFVTILLFCNLRNYCVLEIQDILNKHGKSLSDFPNLPQPDPGLLTQLDNRLIREELNYSLAELRNEHQNLWPFFLYGPGGTGKTFVYKIILTKLRFEKLIALAIASSDKPPYMTNIMRRRFTTFTGGRTAHSRFVIRFELMENSTCRIKQKTHLGELMQEVRLIIWDEVPMTQRFAFEALDKTLKDILVAKNEANRSKLFGGVPILFGGDFLQILPVIPKGKRQEIIQACINRSELWQSCQLHTLSRIMRVNEFTADGQVDPRKQQFNKWVLDIRDGKVPTVCKDREEEPTWIEIPVEFIVKSDKPPIDAIVDTIFPDFLEIHKNEDYLSERAILTPRNDDADQINKHMFKKL
ncbi:uncharacterized protein [Rutidosis leptorrhynchoides]|uniref:uncharacterized protein n=1 Tax=Rutidosis leptorrhynchoides TaxID=125765 RepID=UPI003A995FFE